MRMFPIILLLVTPLIAQTRAELDTKYGPSDNDRYRVRPGIVAEVAFADNGKVSQFRIVSNDPKDPKALLPADDVRMVIWEIVPGGFRRRPHSYAKIQTPCPPRKSCDGHRDVFDNITTLMVWHKKLIAYALVTIEDKVYPPPGNIKMLPGYENVEGYGIDTSAGVIRKAGGLEIHYDIGHMAGNLAKRNETLRNAEWTRWEQTNGDSVLIVLTKNKRIVATFERAVANFYANVGSQSGIDDFIKMVLTYDPRR